MKNKHDVTTKTISDHKCTTWNKTFNWRNGLNVHIKTVHQGVTFDCMLCNGKFSQFLCKFKYSPTKCNQTANSKQAADCKQM